MFALFLGTMGLPHVLVRFYTNPDGRAARKTALTVIALVGLFYLAPSVYGMLGRLYTPELLLTGRTDAVVLLLPQALVGGTAGQWLTALVAAGAAAAFLATATGLTVTVAGSCRRTSWAQDRRPDRVLPSRGCGRRDRSAAARAGCGHPAVGARGLLGVRSGGGDILALVAAGDLVASAHRCGSSHRTACRGSQPLWPSSSPQCCRT